MFKYKYLHLNTIKTVLEYKYTKYYISAIHRGMVGTSVGSESFSDLDFADDLALLAEMLSLMVLALENIDEVVCTSLSGHAVGLTINWSKTKIQTMLDPRTRGQPGYN